MRRKVLALVTSFILVFISVAGVFANGNEVSQLQAYLKENYNNFLNPDLGVDERYMTLALGSMQVFDDGYTDVFNLKDYDFENEYASYLGMDIAALISIGINPNKVINSGGKNYDLVSLLESYVRTNGAVIKDENGSQPTSIQQILALIGLEAANGKYDQEAAALYLINKQDESGAYMSYGFKSPDITGWAIAVLASINRDLNNEEITTSIEKAVSWLRDTQNPDGGWSYSTTIEKSDPNSIASVLFGLLEYDMTGVKNGKYNNSLNINPYDTLLKFQNSDGSFGYSLESNDVDYYAMSQCSWAVSAYTYGPLLHQLSTKCDKLVNGVEDESKPEPTLPVDSPVETPITDKTVNAVKTGDDIAVSLTLVSLIISGGLYLAIKKVG